MAEVRFNKVRKKYGSTVIVDDVDIVFPDGSLTVLVGPSGCGKSTSLRMLAGLEEISGGEIMIDGRVINGLEPRDRDIAMVFQNYALYPHLTVLENIAFPLRATKTRRADALRRAQDVADSLGLGALTSRKPKDLSGGQQQRVAIGRAIIRQPAVFLFDEPLSNLDAKLRVETRFELLQIQRRLGITAVYVTHDQEEAMTMSDRMVVMRDGRVAQSGRPDEIYARPNSVFVATFVGSPKMNILSGTIADGAFTSPSGSRIAVGSTPAHDAVILGVRPDDLTLSPSPTGTAKVALVELLGPRAIVHLDASDDRLTSVVDAAALADLPVGALVDLSVRPGALHLFDPASENRLIEV
ncbi:carbohydrate ABC transporter ATP-binding protein (CUT1 family) [Microcella alkaliphila]|uniref:Carbohydrate ABC transporter ATP-binding protein (CUT1 family) n=1 Tax=Microcella alkaliphila TaxID=279828 RepID=A0A4Q7TVK4_9MICO|nr:ABC transporter ATP-binding protein [Microcella alkaliphila]RZT63922.1 carbohydrate ABC transporter ATP-binding protein (CUT1 family) [Microcella alkaliphila]